jgi:hypothetical protein
MTCAWLSRCFMLMVLSVFGSYTALAQDAGAKPAAQVPEATPAWQMAIVERADELEKLNGPGTDSALRDRLIKMLAEDQGVRTPQAIQAISSGGQAPPEMAATDARLTAELKEIVRTKGWPTISLVGTAASHDAMMLLAHTPDHTWQVQMLPELERLVEANKIEGSTVALVLDKELVNEGKLQRYGTQFKFAEGGMAMYAVEDPAGLDARRMKVLLPPLGAYKEMLAQAYKLKVSDEVVPAENPAAKKP